MGNGFSESEDRSGSLGDSSDEGAEFTEDEEVEGVPVRPIGEVRSLVLFSSFPFLTFRVLRSVALSLLSRKRRLYKM